MLFVDEDRHVSFSTFCCRVFQGVPISEAILKKRFLSASSLWKALYKSAVEHVQVEAFRDRLRNGEIPENAIKKILAVPSQFIGKTYGIMTIVSIENRNKHGQSMVRVRCECGVERVVLFNDLRRMRILRCSKACTFNKKDQK